jgi:hypothetical protein
MEGPVVNAAPLDLVTGVVNLPGIPLTAGSAQYQLYEREETVLGVGLEFRVAAGTPSTDAQILTDVTSIELWDGDAQIVKPMTSTELIALWNRYVSANGVARTANTGIIPIMLLPISYPLTSTQARFGLGRLADDGSGIAKLKIVVNWAAVIATTTLCTPIVTFDPTERRAHLGRHYRLDRITYTQAGTGEQKIPEAFRDTNALACSELLVNTAVGVFVNCTVQQGSELRYYQTRPPMLNQMQERAKLTAIGNRQAIVFNTRNDPSSSLHLRGYPPAELTINWSTAPGASDIIAIKEYDGRVTW